MVRLGDVGEFVAVSNQWRGVNLTRLDEAQNLRTIAAIYAARFEGQILAVHFGQRQHLRLIVERHNRHNRIWASEVPTRAFQATHSPLANAPPYTAHPSEIARKPMAVKGG